jgi:hypothetical protein
MQGAKRQAINILKKGLSTVGHAETPPCPPDIGGGEMPSSQCWIRPVRLRKLCGTKNASYLVRRECQC